MSDSSQPAYRVTDEPIQQVPFNLVVSYLQKELTGRVRGAAATVLTHGLGGFFCGFTNSLSFKDLTVGPSDLLD